MKMKKLLAVVLATSMVMASALNVCAATGTSGSGSSSSGTGASSSGSSSSSAATVQTYAEKYSVASNATIKVGGVDVKTSVSGVYAAKSVQGIAVTTDLNTVIANLGLTGSQKPQVIIYDTDVNKSSLAMACVNAAAEALGATVVSNMYIDLRAIEKGKVITLTEGSVTMKAGLPKTADTSKTYSVVCVQPGGVVTIFDDQDTNPKTVTFPAQAGIGTYAIVGK